MIIVEMRNNELRAIKIKNSGRVKVAQKTSTIEVPFETLSNLMGGNIMPMVGLVHELLIGLNIGDYKKSKFSVVINLEGIMAQRVQIPQVKDKAIIYSVSSALQKENVLISPDNLITYAVLKAKNKKGYDTMAYILDKAIAKSITKIFEHMKLDFQTVDVAPNTLLKAFKSSNYFKSDKPLSLIVDLSNEDVRYFQFKNKLFHMSYLERISSSKVSYIEAFETNVYQFLDEFEEYTLDDIDIILLGEESLIEKLTLNFEGILNIKKFNDELPTFDTRRIEEGSKFIISMGSTIRNDALLSSHYKYDVNLIRDIIKMSPSRNKGKALKNILIVGSVTTVIAGGYLLGLNMSNEKQKEDNAKILEYVESPGVIEQIREKERVTEELVVFENVLGSLTTIESYLLENKMPYNSRVYYSITQDVPLRGASRVVSLVYSGGLIEIGYETQDESTFKDYLKMLQENELVESVEYTGYSSSGAGYSGNISVVLKGSVK